ncbi:L-arabinose transport system permease protein AraQ [compost metagenome]
MDLRTSSDKIFDRLNIFFLSIAMIAVLYPLYFVAIASVSDPNAINGGRVWLFPEQFTLEGYRNIIRTDAIWIGYRNTLLYMSVGTLINVVMTLTGAYPLSRKEFYGRNVFMMMITFTMFFSGGLIPTYLLIKKLHLIHTMWALVLPGAISVWNLIVTRTFFQHMIPGELRDAAAIDGCSDFGFFIRIVLPLSKAITAVMVLFYGVSHWNAFFGALIYLNDERMYPLQLILRNILLQNEVQETLNLGQGGEARNMAETIKYGVIIVGSLPVLILYPFVQKYFAKGVMIGSLKG